MGTTSFWALKTSNPLTTGAANKVKNDFNDQYGENEESNIWKIDKGAQAFNTRITAVENAVDNSFQLYTVNLIWDSTVSETDYYLGTSSLITVLEDEMMFLFYFSKTNTGSVTFKINALDTMALRKIDISTGDYVVMQADDIKLNTPYYVQYKNGQMIFIGENLVQQVKTAQTTANTGVTNAATAQATADAATRIYTVDDVPVDYTKSYIDIKSGFGNVTQTDGGWHVDDAEGSVYSTSISGNATQNGTPTPEAPITPLCLPAGTEIPIIGKNEFAGHTDKFWAFGGSVIDGYNIISSVTAQSVVLPVAPEKTYVFSGDFTAVGNGAIRYAAFDHYPQLADIAVQSGSVVSGQTITTISSVNYLVLYFKNSEITDWTPYQIQVEKGSVSTPYEPYTLHQTLTVPCDLWENDVLKPQTGEVIHGDAVIESYNGEPIPSTYRSSTGNLTPQKQVTNLVTNGDFSNGTTGWDTFGATVSALNNTATLLANTAGGRLLKVISIIINHQYYVKARVKSVSPLVRLDLYDGSSSSPLYHSGNGEYEDLSLVRTSAATSSSGQLQIRDNRTSDWDNVYVQYVISIDLTAAFGAGNEPTAAEMDARLAESFANSWFDGTGTLKGSYVVYKLATPTTDQFTAQPITLPQGAVKMVVESSNGVLPSEMSMEYLKDFVGTTEEVVSSFISSDINGNEQVNYFITKPKCIMSGTEEEKKYARDNLGAEASLNTASTKTTIVDTDFIPLVDSEDSNKTKISLWSNIKSVLKSYFDEAYTAASILLTDYIKPETTSAVVATDSINDAIGKLETKADEIIAEKGAADGIATLDSNGKLVQMPTLPQVGGSRENMLDVWYFGNPVNQRALSSYVGIGYGLDRWKSTNSNLTVDVLSDCVRLTANSNGHGYFRQLFEKPLKGVFTLSALVRGTGSGFLNLATIDNLTSFTGLTGFQAIPDQWTLVLDTFDTADLSEVDLQQFYVRVNQGTTFEVSRCKLEPGTVSTLVNDPPPNPQQELSTCKRYYRLWTTSEARTEALKEVGLMRLASPTLGTINIGDTDYYYADANL